MATKTESKPKTRSEPKKHRAPNGSGCRRYDRKRNKFTFRHGGKIIRADSEEELEIEIAKYKRQRGLPLFLGKITCDTLLRDYFEYWINISYEKDVRTVDGYRDNFRLHILPEIGDLALKQITVPVVKNLITNLCGKKGKLANVTINKIRAALSSCLTSAVEEQILIENPVRKTKQLIVPKRKIVALTAEECKLLLQASKLYCFGDGILEYKYTKSEFLMMMYYYTTEFIIRTACRSEEAFGISWANIDFDEKKAVICEARKECHGGFQIGLPKNENSDREIPLTDDLVDSLKNWYDYQKNYISRVNDYDQKPNLVYCNSVGHIVSSSNYRQRYWIRMLETSGLNKKFGLHRLRHTGCCLLLENGVDLKTVAALLGDDEQTTLKYYAHTRKKNVRKAAEVLGAQFSST